MLESPDINSLNMSMNDVHNPGIFSLVIDGAKPGMLTRVFIADTKLKPFQVQLHTHTYPIKLTVINGHVRQIVAKEVAPSAGAIRMSQFAYQSPLNGGAGLEYDREISVMVSDYPLPVGSQIEMSETEFHTMSCSKGSMWVVEEQGFKMEYSKVLGIPFVTDGLYKEPSQFQINDKFQAVLNVVRKLVLDYDLIKQS